MLTKIPKVGDRVLVVETKTHRDTTPQTVPVEKVGKKYLYVLGEKFDLTGKHVHSFACYSLWDSQEAYDRHFQRRRNITRIKDIVSKWDFGNGLSDEDLEQIANLMEVKP